MMLVCSVFCIRTTLYGSRIPFVFTCDTTALGTRQVVEHANVLFIRSGHAAYMPMWDYASYGRAASILTVSRVVVEHVYMPEASSLSVLRTSSGRWACSYLLGRLAPPTRQAASAALAAEVAHHTPPGACFVPRAPPAHIKKVAHPVEWTRTA